MEKYTKIWGTTQPVFFGNNVEMHRIEVDSGGYCSKHIHNSKFNMFYVECGELRIDQSVGCFVDSTVLCQGDSMTVSPRVAHKFIALRDTIAYEIYWSILDKEDIVRETQGGK